MAGFLRKKKRAVFHRPAFLILGGEIEPAQPGEGNRPGAHGAGLERHIKVAAGQSLVAHKPGGGADRQDFGVGGRVVVFHRAIAGGGDDFSVPDDAGADRRLAARGGGAGLGEGPVPRIED